MEETGRLESLTSSNICSVPRTRPQPAPSAGPRGFRASDLRLPGGRLESGTHAGTAPTPSPPEPPPEGPAPGLGVLQGPVSPAGRVPPASGDRLPSGPADPGRVPICQTCQRQPQRGPRAVSCAAAGERAHGQGQGLRLAGHHPLTLSPPLHDPSTLAPGAPVRGRASRLSLHIPCPAQPRVCEGDPGKGHSCARGLGREWPLAPSERQARGRQVQPLDSRHGLP